MPKQLTTEAKFLLATRQALSTSLRALGYSADVLRGLGYSADVLRGLGYSAADLRALGYSAADLRALGYSADVLRDAGYSAADLREAGYSAADLRDAGYSAAGLRDAGYSADVLRDAGYSAEVDEMLKDVPLLQKPYTRLLEDIRAKRRVHKQSTFGDLEHFEPDENVCGMPMCTGGHFVQMAGEAGFKLKEQYDWSGAYQLLHMKAHPDVPPQNTASIPQDWALAYIETMAEKEAAQ